MHDTVEHGGTLYRFLVTKIFASPWSAGVTPGSTDLWLRWREVVSDNFLEFIANFPENHDLNII
jgi:hypothetical protein